MSISYIPGSRLLILPIFNMSHLVRLIGLREFFSRSRARTTVSTSLTSSYSLDSINVFQMQRHFSSLYEYCMFYKGDMSVLQVPT
jgi:hypothetical protein